MPSPFPGMDPYLESPDIWPDFHDRLAGQVSSELNAVLPKPYYARLEMRPEIGIVGDGGAPQRIVPDVTVVRDRRRETPLAGEAVTSGVAVLDAPRIQTTSPLEVTVLNEPIQHHFVELRDGSQGHKLITLIEIVSPSNKRRGVDREAYLHKQREVLDSDASLIELDLLRAGERLLANLYLVEFVAELPPPADYLVLVNRGYRRIGGQMNFEIYPIGLREMLPCIGVPLRRDEDDVPLDLQFVLHRAYDGGPYRRGAVDYSQPPKPPLASGDAEWANERLTASRGSPL